MLLNQHLTAYPCGSVQGKQYPTLVLTFSLTAASASAYVPTPVLAVLYGSG